MKNKKAMDVTIMGKMSEEPFVYEMANGIRLEKWVKPHKSQKVKKEHHLAPCKSNHKDIITMREFLEKYFDLTKEKIAIYSHFPHQHLKRFTNFEDIKGASFEEAKYYRKTNRVIWVIDDTNKKLPYWNPVLLREERVMEQQYQEVYGEPIEFTIDDETFDEETENIKRK